MDPFEPPASMLPDPRAGVDRSAGAGITEWYRLADASLAAETAATAAHHDRALREHLLAALEEDAALVQHAIALAPSPQIARHLWRELDRAWAAHDPSDASGLAVTPFAIPVVVVAGVEADAKGATLPGVLHDPGAVVNVLRSGGALAGNETFALSAALVRADVLEVAALPQWRELRRLPGAAGPAMGGALLTPAPIRLSAGAETVHLRFLVGTALSAPEVDVLSHGGGVERWGTPFTRELARQLAAPGASVLPLARAPGRPLPARYGGFGAQREVSAQLFMTNALRKFRASVGEPVAVVSAHRADDAPGGGELRVSLSSPFAPRDAEGFRCPLDPIEPVGPVASMLLDLLRDCRVADVRVAPGIHPDRASGAAMRLFFRPETIPSAARFG